MNPFASASPPLKAAALAALALAAALGLSALAAAIALAGLGRLSPGLHLTAAPAWLWYYRRDPHVRRWLTLGAVAAAGAAVALAAAVVRSARPSLHGAARWASEADVRRAGLRAEAGILLGRSQGRLLSFGGSEHVLIYAPTRSGKGVGVVIPNLLSWPDSVVVLDVKRENWDASAGFRAAHGQAVFLFDPLDPEGRTARFNPLGHIRRENPVEVVDELQKLAAMLFPAPDHTDPFWAEAARTGFIGVGAYVAETPCLSFSLGSIYAELTRGDPRSRLTEEIAARDADGRPLTVACRNALSDFCSASENTFASVKQTITARMGLWLNPRVCAATEASDFDLRALRDRRMSIYLAVSPDNLARVGPLYALVFQQLIDLNTRERPSPGRHETPVLLLLDEFARLGHAETLAKAFAFVAGYGLRLLPVLQSPAQLRGQYGPHLAEEIVANCGVEIAFAPKELKLAQELSERLGAYTYKDRSETGPSGLVAGRRSRALQLPQELIQMPADQLIVMRAGAPPVRGRKIVYWRERIFARRVRPPPALAPQASVHSPQLDGRAAATSPALDGLAEELAQAGFEPLPAEGATVREVEIWIERFIDASAQLPDGDPANAR